MNNFIGTNGTITCPPALGVTVKSIQADVNDPTATDTSITLSGVVSGTVYSFSAISPVVADVAFYKDEDVTITSVGASLNSVVINYVFRGDQTANQGEDRTRPANSKLYPN